MDSRSVALKELNAAAVLVQGVPMVAAELGRGETGYVGSVQSHFEQGEYAADFYQCGLYSSPQP